MRAACVYVCVSQDGDVDELDAGEAFERMQTNKVTAVDPDSLAYHTVRYQLTFSEAHYIRTAALRTIG